MEQTQSYLEVFAPTVGTRYRMIEVRNAAAILQAVAPRELNDLSDVLADFQLLVNHLLEAGGSKSRAAKELDEQFRQRGWRETHLQLNVEGTLTKQPWAEDSSGRRRASADISTIYSRGETHKVDNFKERVAIEVEWNAKDGNLDRDLSAFRALYDAGVIDCAVIITRHHASIHYIANYLARQLGMVNYTNGREVERFKTTTTTNIEKLRWRLERGDAGGCPVLAIGICAETYTPGLLWEPGPGVAAVPQPEVPPMDEVLEAALEQAAAADAAGDGANEE